RANVIQRISKPARQLTRGAALVYAAWQQFDAAVIARGDRVPIAEAFPRRVKRPLVVLRAGPDRDLVRLAGPQACQVLDDLRERLIEGHEEVNHLLPEVRGAESIRIAEQRGQVDLRSQREKLVHLFGTERGREDRLPADRGGD